MGPRVIKPKPHRYAENSAQMQGLHLGKILRLMCFFGVVSWAEGEGGRFRGHAAGAWRGAVLRRRRGDTGLGLGGRGAGGRGVGRASAGFRGATPCEGSSLGRVLFARRCARFSVGLFRRGGGGGSFSWVLVLGVCSLLASSPFLSWSWPWPVPSRGGFLMEAVSLPLIFPTAVRVPVFALWASFFGVGSGPGLGPALVLLSRSPVRRAFFTSSSGRALVVALVVLCDGALPRGVVGRVVSKTWPAFFLDPARWRRRGREEVRPCLF